MKRLTKFLSLAIATVIAVSSFTITSSAMDRQAIAANAESHRRAITAEELQAIYTLFNADDYAKLYPDVKQALGTDPQALFNHFVLFGIWEQRQPSGVFNVDVYASLNYDLQQAFGDDIVSYYVYFANHIGEQRYMPTKYAAYWQNRYVYSVYDFVKGQVGPKAGAYVIQSPYYHPDIVL